MATEELKIEVGGDGQQEAIVPVEQSTETKDVVEKIGVKKVESLHIKHLGLDFISKSKDDFYNQHELLGGYLIVTHSATVKKRQQIEEISERLNLGLKVEIV